MKIILSRKGFDSSYGGLQSPVIRTSSGEQRIVSLPIPFHESMSDILFADLPLTRNITMYDFLLHNQKNFYKKFPATCHLDPDISFSSNPNRPDDWKAAFGQDDAAQSVLSNNGVGKGDLFLFFGWFQFAEEKNGVIKYVKNDEYKYGFHMLFGYLQVHDSYRVKDSCPSYLQYHPHYKFHNAFRERSKNNNTIYEATDYFNESDSIKGANYFNFSPELILTKPNQDKRTLWELPDFFSTDQGVEMTYHKKKERWSKENDKTILQTVGKGQEFVITRDPANKIAEWATGLVKKYARG